MREDKIMDRESPGCIDCGEIHMRHSVCVTCELHRPQYFVAGQGWCRLCFRGMTAVALVGKGLFHKVADTDDSRAEMEGGCSPIGSDRVFGSIDEYLIANAQHLNDCRGCQAAGRMSVLHEAALHVGHEQIVGWCQRCRRH